MKAGIDNLTSGIGVFAAVVDAGSFVAAAGVLAMSPPGVSRAIARLEQRLGIRLFHRTTRTIALTEEGRRFHEQVLPHLRGMEDAAAGAAGGVVAVRGRLRVNLDPVMSRFLLGARLDGFLDAYPGLSLELITRDGLGDMVADGFDLALRFGVPRPSSLVARKLLETAVVTVAAPAYLARHGRPAGPRQLAGESHRCLEFRDPEAARPYPWEFHRKRSKIVVPTAGRLTVNEPGALLQACLAGSGIAQMLMLVAEPLIRNGRLVNLFPDWMDERFPLYAYHPSRHHVPARTRAFLDFVAGLSGAATPGGT